jgi:hypothetical protein
MVRENDTNPNLGDMRQARGYSIDVDWEGADALQARLRQRGIPATVVVRPLEKVARLEFPPGVDPSQVRAALRE